MSSHQNFQALATSLIANNGRTVQLREITSTGDAWKPVQSTSDTPVVAVQAKLNNAELDSSLLELGDIKYLIDSSVAPDASMKIVDGDEYSIISVDIVKPGDQTVLYKVYARG